MKIFTISALLVLAISTISAAPTDFASFDKSEWNSEASLRMTRSISDTQINQFTPFEDMDQEDYPRMKRSPEGQGESPNQEGRSFFNGEAIGISKGCKGCSIINPYAGGTYVGK